MKVYAIMDESDALNVKYNGARAAFDLRVDLINKNGGIGGSGRPVQVVYCVTQLDPNQAAECARKATADKDVVATIGSVLGNGDASNPVLEQGGMANLGGVALAASDGTSKISFPVMAGQLGVGGGMAAVLFDQGKKKIGLLYPDTPGGDQTVGVMNAVLAPRQSKVANSVLIPTANPDLSPQVASVSSGVDGVIIAADPTTAQRLVQTFGQSGVKTQMSVSAGEGFNDKVVAQLGSVTEGMYITSFFATDDMPGDGIKAYLDAMKAAGKSDLSDDLAKNSWIALSLLDTLAKSVKTIDRASILDAASKLSTFDSGGFTPKLDFTKPGTFLGGAAPRLVNTTIAYGVVKGGKIVSLDKKFHNPFEPTA